MFSMPAWLIAMNLDPVGQWILAIIAAGLLLLAGEMLLRLLLRLLRAIARRTVTTYDDHLVARLRLPTRLLLVAGVVHFIGWYVDNAMLQSAMVVVEWLLTTFLVVETAETLLVDLILEDRLRIRIPPLLRQVAIGVVYVGAALAVLSHVFGVDVTPLLATTSVVSLVLGLALQQPLSNLFAGLVMHFERPFRDGDWILVAGREGQITHIGWRSTRLRTLSGDIVVMPNNTLLTAEVQNFSAPERATSRLVELPVAFSVPPRDLEAWVRDELSRIPRVLRDPPPKTWLTRYEVTCVRYTIKFWVEDFGIHDDLESDVLKAMWYRLDQEGVPLRQLTAVRVEKPEDPS